MKDRGKDSKVSNLEQSCKKTVRMKVHSTKDRESPMGQVLEYPHIDTHTDVKLSVNFIATIECVHCGGQAPVMKILRGPSPRSESMVEVRLFECRECLRHTVLELVGA